MRSLIVDKRRIILGITGSFGSGKSTVAGLLKSKGAEVIDADKLAHTLIKPGAKVYKRIINTFGKNILKKDKAIDRRRLGRIVFSSKDKLRKLNRIIHPEVIRILRKKIKDSNRRIIILDVPLLVEAGLEKIADRIIVVRITKEKQIERLIKRRSLSRQDILKRISAQMPLSQKLRIADFIIDNSGTIKKTKKQLRKIRRLLWKS